MYLCAANGELAALHDVADLNSNYELQDKMLHHGLYALGSHHTKMALDKLVKAKETCDDLDYKPPKWLFIVWHQDMPLDGEIAVGAADNTVAQVSVGSDFMDIFEIARKYAKAVKRHDTEMSWRQYLIDNLSSVATTDKNWVSPPSPSPPHPPRVLFHLHAPCMRLAIYTTIPIDV
jgi:hypothetical protein